MRVRRPVLVDGRDDLHVVNLDVTLGGRAVDQFHVLRRTRQASHLGGLPHQVPRVDFTQWNIPLVELRLLRNGIDDNIAVADPHRGGRIVAGLPAEFQLQARNPFLVLVDRDSRSTDANSKCSPVRDQVSQFDDQLLSCGDDDDVTRSRRDLGTSL